MNSQSPRFRHVGVPVIAGQLALTFALIFAGGACGGGSGGSGTGGHAGGAAGAAGALGTAGTLGTAGALGTADGGTAGATGTAGAAAANTPAGQCEQFVSTFCTRLDECEPSDGGPDTAVCNALFQVAFNCSAATTTNTSNIGLCISDVAGESCASLFDSTTNTFNEPGSCMTALQNIPPSDAQNKCLDLVDVLCDPVDICNNVAPADATDFQACEADGVQELGCLFVTGETTTYPTCITDLCTTAADAGANANADGGVTLPASCNDLNVLTFPPGTTM
jgi:hypothetical protein